MDAAWMVKIFWEDINYSENLYIFAPSPNVAKVRAIKALNDSYRTGWDIISVKQFWSHGSDFS